MTDSYDSIGKELAATVVPVGSAWREMLEKRGTPELHAEDGSHPTLAGSYLAACVFYTTLLDGDLKDLETEVEGLSHEERRLLQQIAQSASGSEQ